MPYLALYRKYRPQTFGEVYGQKAVVRTLENAFKENKIGHAYLFCGPRGTGKTSMARLFAKALNCAEGLGHQCLKCDSCKAIASGDHPDVIEMDAASNSSVDDVRDIIAQVDYQPIMGRYRVYIIDEVHNMSSSAFNALLKTLEEPPANVIFILCTTEPQKVLPTILSRVQRFDFSRVSDADLTADLSSILKQEEVECEPKALAKIVRLADGGVRDALSLLDQAISYCGGKIHEKDVEDLYGLVDSQTLCDLLSDCYDGNVGDLMRKVRDLVAKGADINRAVSQMIGICRDLLIHASKGSDDLLSEITGAQAKSLEKIPAYRCNTFVDTLVKGQRNLRYSKDMADSFELLLLALAVPSNSVVPQVVKPAQTTTKVVEKTKDIPVREVTAAELFHASDEEDDIVIPATQSKSAPSPAPKEEKVKEIVVNQAVEAEEKKEKEPAPVKEEKKASGAAEEYPSSADVLNLMIQGSKPLKEDLKKGWPTMTSTDEDLRNALNVLKSGEPCVCNTKAILLKVPMKLMAQKINDPAIQSRFRQGLKQVFGIEPQVAAVTYTRFKELVQEFKVRNKNGTLPEKRELGFGSTGGEVHQESNAEKFLRELEEM